MHAGKPRAIRRRINRLFRLAAHVNGWRNFSSEASHWTAKRNAHGRACLISSWQLGRRSSDKYERRSVSKRRAKRIVHACILCDRGGCRDLQTSVVQPGGSDEKGSDVGGSGRAEDAYTYQGRWDGAQRDNETLTRICMCGICV